MIGIVSTFFVIIIITCRLIQCVCKCVRVYIYIYMHMNIRSMLPYIIHVLTQLQQKQSWSAAVTHDGADGHRKVNHFLPRGSQGIPGARKTMVWAITRKGSVVGATAGLTKVGTCGDLSQTYRTLSHSFWGILPTIMGSNINQPMPGHKHWYFLHIPTHYSF